VPWLNVPIAAPRMPFPPFSRTQGVDAGIRPVVVSALQRSKALRQLRR
jgi:hypothetical protein